MITSYPAPLTPAEPARTAGRALTPAPTRAGAAIGSWRYDSAKRSRKILVAAALISVGLHAGLLLGFRHAKAKAAPPQEEHLIALTLPMPLIKEIEEPEPVANDEVGEKPDLGVPVPMQADLPQLPQAGDFVQQIDFSSLIEQPDLSAAKLLTIPENIRRGGSIAKKVGDIFNLADLDRRPEPVFQPAPIYPRSVRREGIDARVNVEFIVDSTGHVLNAVVVETTHHGFDEAATAGVSKWKFQPGMKAGRRVNTRMMVPIVFTFQEALPDP